MKFITFTSFAVAVSLASFAHSHEYVKRCEDVRTPIYDQNHADDALAGAIIGGVLGKAITKKDKGAAVGALMGGMIGANESKKKIIGYNMEKVCENIKLKPHSHQSRIKIDKQKMAIREYQTALNYFGFNAGAVDGIEGKNTANAIKTLQRYVGEISTGKLTQQQEREIMRCYNTLAPMNIVTFLREPSFRHMSKSGLDCPQHIQQTY